MINPYAVYFGDAKPKNILEKIYMKLWLGPTPSGIFAYKGIGNCISDNKQKGKNMDNTEPKYVDIEEAIEYFRTHQGRYGYRWGDISNCLKNDIPSAAITPIKSGEWIEQSNVFTSWLICSECKTSFWHVKTEFCPHCGAHMI